MRRWQYREGITDLITQQDRFGDTVAGTRHASAVCTDELVDTCAITSYRTLLAAKYFFNVRAIAMAYSAALSRRERMRRWLV